MNPTDPYVPALGFRWLTPLYDSVVGLTARERRFKHRLLQQAALRPGWRVLDLGCGTGTLTGWAKRAQPEAKLIGLDGDDRILARARNKAHDSGCRVNFLRGLSDGLPFADGSFDCVLSSLFFHHLAPDQKATALTEIRRVLKPGAEFHIADWGAAAGPISRALFYPVQLLDGFPNTSDHVAGKLPSYLSQAGFRDVAVQESIFTTYGVLSLVSGRRSEG